MDIFELSFSNKELQRREEALRERVASITNKRKSEYFRELEEKIKDPDTYVALCYSLGFGFHHLYLSHFLLFFLDLVASLIFWFQFLSLLMGDSYSIFGFLIFSYNISDFILSLIFGGKIVWNHNLKTSDGILKRFISEDL